MASRASAGKRVRQLLSHDVRDLLWLGYAVTVAPWGYRASALLHAPLRWQLRRSRQQDVERRIESLRGRFEQDPSKTQGYRIALASLSPQLEEICRPLRRVGEEIPLASIDQDGLLCPRFECFWEAPRIHRSGFLPRNRFELMVVDRDGWVGVRKDFRGDKVAFSNELEAGLDLLGEGCHVAPIFAADFEKLTITFAYIDGIVVREALAQAGAPLRDRDVPPNLGRLRYRKFERERQAVGRRLVDKVLDHKTVLRLGDALLAIHRAGYTLEDVKYGNVIIEAVTQTPYFVDCERALPLRSLSRATALYVRDRDAEKLNRLFGTTLLTAKMLRRFHFPVGTTIYSPFCAGAGLWWGSIWNPDRGVLRWRYMLAKNVPVPRGGRVLDLGANNGVNALQMLRAGASEVVGIELNTAAIRQGLFVKRVFEWFDNAAYRFSYVRGSHVDVGSMNLGRFDLVTAFCTLYYLSDRAMAQTVSDLTELTDTLVLQCNNGRSFKRSDVDTFTKASLRFNVDLLRNNGFPNVTVIEQAGSDRPLVIGRRN